MGDEDGTIQKRNEGQETLLVENQKGRSHILEIKSTHASDPDYEGGLTSTNSNLSGQMTGCLRHSAHENNLELYHRVGLQHGVTHLKPTSHVSQGPDIEIIPNSMSNLPHISVEPNIDSLQRARAENNTDEKDRLVIFGQTEMRKLTEEAKARKRNRLSFFNSQRMRILRLSANGHLPEELKTMQWCVLCGGKKDGYRGKKASYRCAACAKPLCTRTPYKKQGGNEKSCWVIWHTTDLLKNRTYNHPLARTSYLDENLHGENISRTAEGNVVANDTSSGDDDNKDGTTGDAAINTLSESRAGMLKNTPLNVDSPMDKASKLDGIDVAAESVSQCHDRQASIDVNQTTDHTMAFVEVHTEGKILELRNKPQQNEIVNSKTHNEEKGSDDRRGVVRCEPEMPDAIKMMAKSDELGLPKRPRITRVPEIGKK